MKFEEQFPSLEGKTAHPLKWRIPFREDALFKVMSDVGKEALGNDYIEVDVYPENVIQKHCLDKTKVEEAFRSCATIWDYEKAKKELGL